MRVIANKDHEAAYQDIIALVVKHAGKVDATQMLAIAANLVGKLVAMQDQRTMTTAMALDVIKINLENGNAQMLAALTNTKGSA